MQYFWDTGDTIPPGAGFSHYGFGHLLWLALWAGLCVFFACRYRKWSVKAQRGCRVAVALLLLLDEGFKYAVTVPFGKFQPDFLPLHLCSINIFVILADAFTRETTRCKNALREILFAICMPGAFFALLFPGWAYLPIKNALCIHSFLAHILLFLYPFLLLLGGFTPKLSRFLKALPFCLPVVGAVYFMNLRLDTNFMFLRYAGEGNPLSLFEHFLGTPGYLLGLPVLCAATWALLYGGVWLHRGLRKRAGHDRMKKTEQTEEQQ